jgi:hypothetical protein
MGTDRGKYARERKQVAGKSVEELLQLLGSGNLRTRFLAEMGLRDATGT